MDDVKTGKIDCIVVKDLSRFGRNFVETGNYIERVFPYLNIRFIAIIDNFDTNCADNDIIAVAFKNLINEFYSRDISEKIKSSLLTKQLEGKYLSGLAPYGYKRDQKDKYSLVIDEETAPTVRRIFEMKYKGKSYSEIAKQLNSENIVPPFAYAKGEVYNTDKKNKFWSDCVIRSILKNRVYIGCNVSKRQNDFRFHQKYG